ncbi:MAG: F0F1 ATP synthase subunit delta [Candidatus Omnitrophica bacterium]|nr:F0F1 ATP synthase subunit delta [Candidatus Omnitrophota bacterium]
MAELGLLGKVLILQVLAAIVVGYVLKRLMDRELMLAALERVEMFAPAGVGDEAEKVVIVSAGPMPAEQRARFVAILKDKLPHAEIEFLENADLRGGVVIEIAGEVLDFSLVTRLQFLIKGYGKKNSGYYSRL